MAPCFFICEAVTQLPPTAVVSRRRSIFSQPLRRAVMAITKLLVLYTGGTIGMQMGADGLAPASGFEARLRARQAQEQERQLPAWIFRELLPPIDSANMRSEEHTSEL